VVAALIQADRRTDGRPDPTKVIGAFSDCTKAPKTYTTGNVLLRNIETLSRNYCRRAKAIIIKYWGLCVYILTLAIRHANNTFSA
jgi:hypothetical protein